MMISGRRRTAASLMLIVAVVARDIRLRRLARAELAAAAGHTGQRTGLLRGPGADARCQQSATELAGAGRRRDGRQCHEDRAPGLACVGDHAPQWRRRPARQRHRQARPDQLAGFAAHRAGAADRRPTARQAARRLADSVGAQRSLPDHRADAGGAVDGAQRRRNRPRYRTSPRRSAPRSGAARKICEA